MKLTQNLLAIFMTGAALIYTGCKKSETFKPSTITTPPTTIAQNAAYTLYQLVNGELFAAGNLSDSLYKFGPGAGGGCGLTLDLDAPLDLSTDSVNVSGNAKIFAMLNCTDTYLSGIDLAMSISTTGQGDGLSVTFDASTDAKVSLFDPFVNQSGLRMSGSVNVKVALTYTGGVSGSTTESFQVNSATYSQKTNKITTAMIDFVSFGTSYSAGVKHEFSYKGTIQFNSTNSAIVTIDGKDYKVKV